MDNLKNGAAFCQIIDVIYPGDGMNIINVFLFLLVSMSKVNFNAEYYNDISKNYTIFQEALAKLKVRTVCHYCYICGLINY
jgi:hypothetical protein